MPPITRLRPRVFHIRDSGWDVRVDRTSMFGNPFIMQKSDDPMVQAAERRRVIKDHKDWLLGVKHRGVTWWGLTGPQVRSRIDQLEGKSLACWCAPHACHADTLLELANRHLAGFQGDE